MKKWKTSFFGYNAINFYGWIFTGILILTCSALSIWMVFYSNDMVSVLRYGFLTISLLLSGILGLMLQNYHCKSASVLDKSMADPKINKSLNG